MNELLHDISFEINKIESLDTGSKYQITIKVPMEIGWIEQMKFIVRANNEQTFPMHHLKNKDGFAYFTAQVFLETHALYHYYFSFEANNNLIYYQKNSNNKKDMWKMSVNFETPSWAKGKIMYHIFVDRFNKNNNLLLPMEGRIVHESWDEDIVVGPDENGRWNIDFYGGNLKGIIEKLDYLKSLGVSIIYLSPIFLSQSNHRYDTADYEKVDPYAGTNEDLKLLCLQAHQKGMKIILDGVFNHTGNDSKYFNEYNHYEEKGAYQSKESKYYDFYKKQENGNFCYWWDMKNLPVCDGNSKQWQNYIYGKGGIIDLWFSLGIDGIRLDVADELTDEFIEGITAAVKRNKKDGFILGEVWENPMRMNRKYISSGKAMDTVMNYQLTDALIRYYKYAECDNLKDTIEAILNEYPKETIDCLMNFTSTHDITRAINIFGTNEFQRHGKWAWDLQNNDYNWQKEYQMTKEQYDLGKEIYKSYLYTLAFFPGILSIFYGDEIGMQAMGNLANRRPYTWDRIDTELLELFKLIGKIRKKEKFLETAGLELLDVNENYLSFKRTSNHEEALVYTSRSNTQATILLPEDYLNEDVVYSLNNSNKQLLDSYGAVVLKKTK